MKLEIIFQFIISFVSVFNTHGQKDKDFSQCGLNPDDSTFIAGPIQEAGQWPWMATFGYYDKEKWKHLCGATLVSNQHFITSAHCITGSNSFNTKLRVGLTDLNSVPPERFSMELEIESSMTHPRYDDTAYFDIAVIKTKPITFTKHIRPVCLPTEASVNEDKYKNILMTIIGWGAMFRTGKTSDLLKRADVRVFPKSHCNSVHEAFQTKLKELIPRLFESQIICAGNTIGKEGSCKGDSGGPLLFYETETSTNFYLQIGMVQGSIGECGDKNIPGIFVRLDDPLILEFLNSQLQGDTRTVPTTAAPTTAATVTAASDPTLPLHVATQSGIIRSDDNCQYHCKPGGSCTARIISQSHTGSVQGSCFPPEFGGECFGIPDGCQKCLGFCASQELNTPAAITVPETSDFPTQTLTNDDHCLHFCKENGGCSVEIRTSKFFTGASRGSCFPPDFGGECSGIPEGCGSCLEICSSKPGETIRVPINTLRGRRFGKRSRNKRTSSQKMIYKF